MTDDTIPRNVRQHLDFQKKYFIKKYNKIELLLKYL